MLLMPWFLHKLLAPKMQDASAARDSAREQLREMGAWSRNEKIMLGVFVLLLLLWATSKWLHGMHTGVVALVGVLILLMSGAEKWEGITGNREAWDAFVWLGGMVSMAAGARALVSVPLRASAALVSALCPSPRARWCWCPRYR